ncbi:MAG TPA: DUF1175 family protein [Anaeromyxobacter sp.]|nr:DUF1175 family protein [Anaeromyxobacter sp.]
MRLFFLAALVLSARIPGALAAEEARDRGTIGEPGGPSAPAEALLRRLVAEIAVAQAHRIDPAWEEQQRDCAGLVRFAYRRAFAELAPARVAKGLFRDGEGRPVHFADAGTLLRHSFTLLGRDEIARRRVRSGDLAAFAREEDGKPVFHLMLLVVPDDPAHAPVLVVYHPGEPQAEVRVGRLDDLTRDAPPGWRPVRENPLFLGFYRLKEWSS